MESRKPRYSVCYRWHTFELKLMLQLAGALLRSDRDPDAKNETLLFFHIPHKGIKAGGKVQVKRKSSV